MNRRNLIKALIAGPMLEGFGFSSNAQNKHDSNFPYKKIKDSAVSNIDVIVCGGGPAGFAAALSSARSGAKTVLIEKQNYLGGTWTAGLLTNIIDYQNKKGILKELMDQLDSQQSQYTPKCYDNETMKYTLERMCIESGIFLRYQTRVCYVSVNDNLIDYIITDSISGFEKWKATTYIDATGNGDVGQYADCSFDLGDPITGETQPASMMAVLSGFVDQELIDYGVMAPKGNTTEAAKRKLYSEIEKAGIHCSYGMPTFFGIRPGLLTMMANHEYEVKIDDANSLTQHTINARNEINKIVNGLRSLGGVWSNLRLVATSEHLGIREGRRIKGVYQLTKNDLIAGSKFEDAVCKCTFGVDIHTKDKNGYSSESVHAKPYDIPLRSLISSERNNLLMAGRCISGDYFAHASYRVVGNAVPMGESAGKLAAYSSKNEIIPRDVDYKKLHLLDSK